MPIADDADAATAPRSGVRIGVSGVVELYWLLIGLAAPNKAATMPIAAEIAAATDVAEDVRTFWGDGIRDFVELLPLARAADALIGGGDLVGDALAERLLGALAGEVPIGLESEPDEDRAAAAARIAALRADARLRARWRRLIARAWEVAAADWDAGGRAAVERTVGDWQSRLEGNDLRPLIGERHIAVGTFRRETEDALRSGTAVLAPSHLAASRSLYFTLAGHALISIGVHRGIAARRGDAESVANIFKVLADPTRLLIMAQLSTRPMTVTELAGEFGLAQPTVSVHVRQLREAGLVRTERANGRSTIYGVVGDDVEGLLDRARRTLLTICD
jgi:DNA-binding transcriptional ArsR family regulator